MNEKILYGYSGIFDTPDEIIHAAEKAVEKGYRKYDVHSPYPIHGMPKAMNLKPSKLGYISMVVGLSGALSAILIMFWMSAVDYPTIIGGKPFFSFPAYVPVMFEVTVLSASIATVLAMLFIFFKMPNNAHPLNDTEYMKKVSSDKYGIVIQSDDNIYNENKKFHGVSIAHHHSGYKHYLIHLFKSIKCNYMFVIENFTNKNQNVLNHCKTRKNSARNKVRWKYCCVPSWNYRHSKIKTNNCMNR